MVDPGERPPDMDDRSAPPFDEPVEAADAIVHSSAVPPGRADMTARIVAGVIDAVVGAVVGLIPLVGGVVASAYWLTRDGLDLDFMPHRSIGKKLTGLQAVTLDGQPLDLEGSIRRNWPLAIGGLAAILAWIPIAGWLLAIPVSLIAVLAAIIEIALVFTDDEGRRFGDKFADTKVIEVGESVI